MWVWIIHYIEQYTILLHLGMRSWSLSPCNLCDDKYLIMLSLMVYMLLSSQVQWLQVCICHEASHNGEFDTANDLPINTGNCPHFQTRGLDEQNVSMSEAKNGRHILHPLDEHTIQ